MIVIPKDVENLIPTQFKELKQGVYRLTKITTKSDWSMIKPGIFVEGPLSIVSRNLRPHVVVDNNNYNGADYDSVRYIKTSPVVKVLDLTDGVLNFETEGGTYRLEKL